MLIKLNQSNVKTNRLRAEANFAFSADVHGKLNVHNSGGLRHCNGALLSQSTFARLATHANAHALVPFGNTVAVVCPTSVRVLGSSYDILYSVNSTDSPVGIFDGAASTLVFSCSQGTWCVRSDSTCTPNLRSFTSLALCGFRYWGAKGSKVYFTSQLAEEWVDDDTADYLSFDAPVRALVARDNDLFVFTDISLYKLTVGCCLQQFLCKKLATDLGGVLSNSAVVTPSGKLLFATAQGFFLADGNKVTPALANFPLLPDSLTAVACGSHRGTIYLSVNGKMVLALAADCLSVTACHNVVHQSFVANQGGVFLLSDDDVLGLTDGIGESFWQSKPFNFGKSGVKTLLGFEVVTQNPVTVTVSSDVESRTAVVDGGGEFTFTPLSVRGSSFTITIASSHKVNLSHFAIVASQIKEANS